eukprot:4489375-Heterocapsa_arctica.AAC.1
MRSPLRAACATRLRRRRRRSTPSRPPARRPLLVLLPGCPRYMVRSTPLPQIVSRYWSQTTTRLRRR